MRKKWTLSEDTLQNLKAAMAHARDKAEYQRALCFWLPVALGLSARQVATALGLPAYTVEYAWTRYRRQGERALRSRRPQPLPAEAVEAMRTALKQASSADDLRRLQCLWLRERLSLDVDQVAAALDWGRWTVIGFQSRYQRRGLAALQPAAGTLDSEHAQKLEAALKSARTVPEFRRAQCLWMRVVLGLSSSVVARALGWRQTSVCTLRAKYLRQGEPALGLGRGGVRRQILDTAKEAEVLRGLSEQAWPLGLLKFPEIQRAVEAAAGRPLKASSVQAILDRHGWSRAAVVVAPPPAQKREGRKPVPPGPQHV